ncbi:polyisoprenoid-binding protein YceI [Chitinophaga skermanii]|uniref:Polyisoprenoid-binding protein YceI n=1 Tax=Chitinophaga skermanii TaxID=331697 RepID=A0A327QSE8_9BACT|nr:YceI family protein [Chitinophaga skermanii]RAJ06622.1 polyisoprenoid-binding protein YceI [Chitinophaga skermanii]
MKKLTFILATLLASAAVFAFAFTTEWKVGPKYNIAFSAGEVSGIFKTFTGSLFFDDKDLAGSKFNVSIDVNSINTGNGLQNKHAKDVDWFDAAKYPTITFASKKFAKTGAGYTVTGDLTLHGVKKEISIPFTFANNTFAGTFQVNRNDYKVGKPGGDVEDIVKLTVSVPVVKK